MASPGTLIAGYWGVNPSPVVDDYAGAWTALSGPAAGAWPGTAPRAWVIRRDQSVSPGPDGRPTTGYPAPTNPADPVWIATSLAGGAMLAPDIDYTIADDYIWFVRDPLLDLDGYLIWDGSAFIQAATLWAGVRPVNPDETEPLAGTHYALMQAIAAACDSPATGPTEETVEDIWEAGDGTFRVITNLNAYVLNADDTPSVEIDDVLPPGSPLGSAWVIDQLDHETASDFVTTPAAFHRGVTSGDITWHRASTPLVIDTVSDRTRVRFALGGVEDDVGAVWTESMAAGLANGRTLAQALDTRSSPSGDPDETSLPRNISPMEFFCRELSGGLIYRLVVFPARFGSDSLSVSELRTAVRTAAGSYATVFIWEDEEPYRAAIDPPNPATTTTAGPEPTTTTTAGPTTTTTAGPTTTTTAGPMTTTTASPTLVDCCTDELASNPDLNLIIQDGTYAGTHLAEWIPGESRWGLLIDGLTAPTGDPYGNVRIVCADGAWNLRISRPGDDEVYPTTDVICDPLEITWDETDAMTAFGTTLPLVVEIA